MRPKIGLKLCVASLKEAHIFRLSKEVTIFGKEGGAEADHGLASLQSGIDV